MIFTPDRRWIAGLAAVVLTALAGPGGAAEGPGADLVRKAHAYLAKGDGIAAEIALRKAMAAGLPREAVAARMGEAFLDQNDLRKAREWLGPARFVPAEAAHGFRVLGRLEMAEGRYAAAGQAFDRALQLTPNDSRLWVDVARLRYAGGEQVQSADAIGRALALDPENARALEFSALLVRDRFGLSAALPWLERALKVKPDDLSVLGEYAATLGELGRTAEMLSVTRRMIELDHGNARAFLLQATMAARAGKTKLARRLLDRAGPGLSAMPAARLLQGALELDAGNTNLAVDIVGALFEQQPQNGVVRSLLARALAANRDDAGLVARFAADAERSDAPAYLLTLVGRAYENLGQRERAAPLLERAASIGTAPVMPIGESAASGSLDAARGMLAGGRRGEALAIAEQSVARAPGSVDAQILAGDMRMANGNLAGAVEAYRVAATVRLDGPLMLRLVDAYSRGGHTSDAERLVMAYAQAFPRDHLGLSLSAGYAARAGNWPRAAAVLGWLERHGESRDARLQADFALALSRSGKTAEARAAAARSAALQPASRLSAEAVRLAGS